MEYVYYMTQRPACPGAQPSAGLIRVEDNPPMPAGCDWDRQPYSRLVYNRPLERSEIEQYELRTDEIPTVEIYKGYEIAYIPWSGETTVRMANDPGVGVVAYADSIEAAKADIDGL